MSQLAHDEVNFERQKFPITLVLHELSSPANIGSIFRLADAFGVEEIILSNCNFEPNSNRFKRTARNTEHQVNYKITSDVLALLKSLESTHDILALEITDSSKAIDTLDFKEKPVVLIVGSERNGVHDDILEIAKKSMHITMYGKNSSMNVAQATGIALFQITKTLTS